MGGMEKEIPFPDRHRDVQIEGGFPRKPSNAKPGICNSLWRHKHYMIIGLLAISFFTFLAVSTGAVMRRRLPVKSEASPWLTLLTWKISPISEGTIKELQQRLAAQEDQLKVQ